MKFVFQRLIIDRKCSACHISSGALEKMMENILAGTTEQEISRNSVKIVGSPPDLAGR